MPGLDCVVDAAPLSIHAVQTTVWSSRLCGGQHCHGRWQHCGGTAAVSLSSMLQHWATLSTGCLISGYEAHQQQTFGIPENHCCNFAPEVTALNLSHGGSPCVSMSWTPFWSQSCHDAPTFPHLVIIPSSNAPLVDTYKIRGCRHKRRYSSALRPNMWASFCNQVCQTFSCTLAGKMLSCTSILYIFTVCSYGWNRCFQPLSMFLVFLLVSHQLDQLGPLVMFCTTW